MTADSKNILVYYLSNFFVNVSRTLPHSILTVLLLSKGVNLSQILIIQSAYSLALVLFEFPSGVLADTWSKKKLYIVSKLFLLVMFLFVLLSNSFVFLYLAWFCYGLAAALDSGTLDTFIINRLKITGKEKRLSTFLSRSKKVELVAMILGSFVGGILYFVIADKIYILSIICIIISMTITYFLFDTEESRQIKFKFSSKQLATHILQSLKELKDNRLLRYIILFNLFSQLFFQGHFQLWQAFFLEKGISAKYFSIFYLLFQLISIASYSMNIENLFKKRIYRYLIPLILALPITFYCSNFFLVVLAYFIYIFLFYVIEFVLDYKFHKIVSLENISSLVSLQSTIKRIGSIIIINLISMLVRFVDVQTVLIILFSSSVLLTLFLIFLVSRRFKSDIN